MYEVEHSITINRPVQEVFDYVSNPANDTEWLAMTRSTEWTSDGPAGVGSTYRSVGRFLGRDIEAELEITKWDPPHEHRVKAISGPIPVEMTHRFESNGEGTVVTVSGQLEFGGFFKMAEGLVGKQVDKSMRTDLETLKRMLENGS